MIKTIRILSRQLLGHIRRSHCIVSSRNGANSRLLHLCSLGNSELHKLKHPRRRNHHPSPIKKLLAVCHSLVFWHSVASVVPLAMLASLPNSQRLLISYRRPRAMRLYLLWCRHLRIRRRPHLLQLLHRLLCPHKHLYNSSLCSNPLLSRSQYSRLLHL